MDNNIIYKKIEESVTVLLEHKPDSAIVFNNLEHNQNVVKHAVGIRTAASAAGTAINGSGSPF